MRNICNINIDNVKLPILVTRESPASLTKYVKKNLNGDPSFICIF